jgi:hypothetical protein
VQKASALACHRLEGHGVKQGLEQGAQFSLIRNCQELLKKGLLLSHLHSSTRPAPVTVITVRMENGTNAVQETQLVRARIDPTSE